MSLYTPEYYDAILEGSRRSAEIIAPIVIDLLDPASVIDVGCGTGAWLRAFSEKGVGRIFGLDGSHVRRDRLLIPPDDFVATDLSEAFPVSERFDLALCLEVAEHLPPERSEHLVGELTRVADAVLISAAIPYQGGEGHVNERWPSFWYDLFTARGFVLIDAVRRRVWSDRAVEPWYQQNVTLYVSESALASRPALRRERELTHPEFLSVIHPRIFGLLLEREGIKPPGPWQPGHSAERAARGSQREHSRAPVGMLKAISPISG